MTQRYSLLTFLIISFTLMMASCSSSTSSSSGRGQIPTGLYVGVFNGQNSAEPSVNSTRVQLSISTVITPNENANSTVGSISGSLAVTGGDRCFDGGSFSDGVLNGDQLSITITTNNSLTINMNGRVTDDQYDGTFSMPSSFCGSISGGFQLERV